MPSDARYRQDQPFPVGTRVVMLPDRTPGQDWGYDEMCRRNGSANPAAGAVIAIGDFTFHGQCPVRILRGHDELIADYPTAECVQWPEHLLVPVDELAPVTAGREAIEEWLQS